MNTIYTIGYSKHKKEYFIKLIQKYNINVIIDVRSNPLSKFNDNFNKNEISSYLKSKGINYIYMGEELGARRKEQEVYTKEGYVDFSRVEKTKKYISGIDRIMNGLKKGYTICIMCAEKDPSICHRSILICKTLSEKGVCINHILEDGNTINQSNIEKQLIDSYFPNRNQVSFFGEGSDVNSYIEKAYKKRNYEIAYRRENYSNFPPNSTFI